MIEKTMIEANILTCQLCGYRWLSIAVKLPTHCQNRKCRSREWNGKKPKHVPEKRAKVVLPKAVKVRGGNDEDF